MFKGGCIKGVMLGLGLLLATASLPVMAQQAAKKADAPAAPVSDKVLDKKLDNSPVPLAKEAGPVNVAATTPVVVEVFTSTNCPSCPATEAKLNGIAADRTDLLVVLEHIDYWNKGAAVADPHSSPDFTQRQYDYSNKLSERPGAVFTPQPVLDGQWVANPPLWFNWNSTLNTALSAQPKAPLALSKTDKGISVRWPVAMKGNYELVVMGLVKDDKNTNLWRATAINILEAGNESSTNIGSGDLPKGDKILVLLQEAGAGAVRATGVL